VTQSFDNQLGFIGRATLLPLKGDGYLALLGVHGRYAGGPDVAGTTARYPVTFQERPELRVDGTRLVSTDANHASTLGFEAGAQYLTGEARRFNQGTFAFDGPAVDHPFSLPDGTWGAWELALRYSKTDLNYHEGARGTAPSAEAIRGGEQTIWAAGVNWYVNAVTRFMLQHQRVKADRLPPSATTFATPIGAQIGQRYHTVALRSQFAFQRRWVR